MPWLRLGDNSATYPALLQVAGFPGADARAVNEVRGFLLALAAQSAGHTTDYRIDYGTAQMFGGARTKKLIGWCVKAGLLLECVNDDLTSWVLLDDNEFIHLRTRAEIDWERQRRADSSNTGLTVPVRRRDGDNCRYCGVLVFWRGRKSNRSAELDHVDPGTPATIATFVVACRTCNGAKQENPQWIDDHPLRPAPSHPHYGPITAAFLTENGYPTDPNVEPGATTARSSGPAAAAPHGASSAIRSAAPVAASPDTQAAGTPPEAPAEVGPKVPQKSTSCSAETRSPGSGRGGPGPGSGPGTDPAPAKARRRRGGRGGRRPAPPAAPVQQPHPEEIPVPTCCVKPFTITDESGTVLCLTCGTES